MSVITGNNIDRFRAKVLLKGLELEIKGLRCKGQSCYAKIKDEFQLHGSRQKVYDQFKQILKD